MDTHPTILIIEDNPDVIFTIKSALENSYNLIYADNLTTTLSALENSNLALILQDLTVPDVSYQELNKKIKIFHKQTPIIALAEFLDKYYENQIMVDFDGIFIKPIDIMQLKKTVEMFVPPRSPLTQTNLITIIQQCLENKPSSVFNIPAEINAINDEHKHRLIHQLERQLITKNDLIRRCALQASHLTMLGGIANILTKNMAIDWNIENIISTCLDLAGISRGGLYLSNADGKMKLNKIIGYKEDEQQRIKSIFNNEEILTQIRRNTSTVIELTISNNNHFIIKNDHNDSTVALLASFSFDQYCSGAVLLESNTAKFDDPNSIMFARNLATQISQAIQLAKVFERTYYSEERYRVLMENASCGIFLLDQEHQLFEINKQGEKLLNCNKTAVLNIDFKNFISKYDLDNFKFHMQEIFTSQVTGPLEIRIKPLNAPERIIEYTGAEIKTKNESVLMIMATDVSERNKLRNQALMNDKLATVGTLAASVAHEINNPISWVMTNIILIKNHLNQLIADFKQAQHEIEKDKKMELIDSLLNKIQVSIDFNELINESLQGIERIKEIVKNMRAFAHMDQHDLINKTNDAKVDLHEILNVAISMASIEFKFRARLEKHFVNNLPHVTANGGKLHQVFLNLIVNASQAIPEGNLNTNFIKVATQLEGNFVRVDISDSGKGISEEILPQIFEPFFTTKPVDQGTGLGLAICQEIIAELNGHIKVESKIDVGTTFSVYLPIATHASTTSSAIDLAPDNTRKHILIIDDELYLLKSLNNILRHAYNTTTVLGGKNAIDMLNTKHNYFDLILCDLQMPDIDGAAIYQHALKINPGLEQKIIFLTGGLFTPHLIQFTSQLTNSILEKPFQPDDLLKLIAITLGA